jgi:hypothetical protein
MSCAPKSQPFGFLPIWLDSPEACRAAVDQTIAQFGRIDALVNHIGVNDHIGLEHGTPEAFLESIKRNLWHYYSMAHFCLPCAQAVARRHRQHRLQSWLHRPGQHLRLRRRQGRRPRPHPRVGRRARTLRHPRQRHRSLRGLDRCLRGLARHLPRPRRAQGRHHPQHPARIPHDHPRRDRRHRRLPALATLLTHHRATCLCGRRLRPPRPRLYRPPHLREAGVFRVRPASPPLHYKIRTVLLKGTASAVPYRPQWQVGFSP